ncbi:MAG: ABC-F family ATP-binding cassette domain-containing protein [Clostridia bacterium]|nr:ABC-F family ATP-binding cassette domain-containing protein [Clostridia bacterium]
MVDIAVAGMDKYFGDTPILLDISFEIYEGRHAGLVGKNGSGKTTLFRVLTGEYGFDKGTVAIPSSKRLGVLDQTPKFSPGDTVEDVLRSAFSEVDRLAREMKECEEAMARGEPYAVRRYGELSVAFELAGGYEVETDLNRVSLGLGIDRSMREKRFAVLSGGEQTRVNLARLILERTDILLLDEPTNHLDMSSIRWLEEFLMGYKGTVMVVSHDRYFLDRVTDMTIELENLHSEVYDGNYSFYAEAKEDRLALQAKQYEREQKEIARLEFTAKRMHGWGMGASKMMKRAKALERRIEKMRENAVERVKKERALGAAFRESDRSGNDVCYIRDLRKHYGEKTLFSGVSFDIKKDESIALIGDNGTGKTTFLRILLGEEEPDDGRIRWGSNVNIAYLPQKVSFLNEYNSVLEETMQALGISAGSARNRLGSYHFIGEDVFKMVGDLSGGERSRLRLCILMYAEVNLLILDEPTNHLDIASCEWMEEAIENYEGTLLFVSHDRYFINRFATRILELHDGELSDFPGTFMEYTAYLEKKEREEKAAPPPPREKTEKPRKKDGLYEMERERRAAKKKANALEREIARLEEELAAIEKAVAENAADHEKLLPLLEEQTEKQAELDARIEEWTAASEAAGE